MSNMVDKAMTPQAAVSMRELDSRTGDGFHVRLMWSQADGRVSVLVDDMKADRAFSVHVPRGERALHVFHHPFAYAT